MKKRSIVLLLALILLLGTCAPAFARMPYKTFTLGVNKNLVETQTAYEPVRSMIRFGDETLKDPQDLRMGPDGNLYIADTGNKRVLVVSRDGAWIASGYMDGAGVFSFNMEIPENDPVCRFTVRLDNASSPLENGESGDGRLLALAMRRIRVYRADEPEKSR